MGQSGPTSQNWAGPG